MTNGHQAALGHAQMGWRARQALAGRLSLLAGLNSSVTLFAMGND